MSQDRVHQVAEALHAAAVHRRAIAPPSATWPALTVAEAYEVQRAIVARRGSAVVGHKVGLTSHAMQDMLGIDTPDFGHLLADMALPDGGTVPADRFLAPRAEIEIAFLLRRAVRGPGVTAADVRAATGQVRAAIEIIDSRVADWRIGLVDTVADNASSGAYVLAPGGCDPADLDLPGLTGTLRHNGRVVAAGDGAAVLGDPALAVAWLANALAGFGADLQPGQVVLSGACARAVAVVAGDTVTGEFDRLGRVTVTFS